MVQRYMVSVSGFLMDGILGKLATCSTISLIVSASMAKMGDYPE